MVPREMLDIAARRGVLPRTQALLPGARKRLLKIKMPTRFAGVHFIISGLTPISRHNRQMRWLPTSRRDRQRQSRSRHLLGAAHQLRHPPQLRQPPQLPLQPRRLAQHRGLLRRQGLVRRRDLAPLLCLVRSCRQARGGTRLVRQFTRTLGSLISAPSAVNSNRLRRSRSTFGNCRTAKIFSEFSWLLP